MTTYAIIEVATRVSEAELTDSDVAGVYVIPLGEGPGEYSMTPRNETADGDDPLGEAALDVFHDRICIEVLDDFEIVTRILGKDVDVPFGARCL